MKEMTAFSQLTETYKLHDNPIHPNDSISFQKQLAQTVVEGNIIGAFGMAFDALKVSPTKRSIAYGSNCTKTMLRGSDDPLVLQAITVIDDMI